MKIVTPYARLIAFEVDGSQKEFSANDGIGLLRRIEWNARISHRSEDAQTGDSWRRFVQAVVVDKGDWSVVEHAVTTVDAVVDRGITHEWVRHRLFSFTQESTRFVNYKKKVPASFIDPFPSGQESARLCWQTAVEAAEVAYCEMIARGIAPQLARSVFPNALASRISTTGNLRNWRHFFLMRTTREAHPQMRQVSIPLLSEFQEKIPLLYDDIVPMGRQADNLKLPR